MGAVNMHKRVQVLVLFRHFRRQGQEAHRDDMQSEWIVLLERCPSTNEEFNNRPSWVSVKAIVLVAYRENTGELFQYLEEPLQNARISTNKQDRTRVTRILQKLIVCM